MEKTLMSMVLETLKNTDALGAVALNITSSIIYDSAKQLGRTLWLNAKSFFRNETEAEKFLELIASTPVIEGQRINEQINKVLQTANPSVNETKLDTFIPVFHEWLIRTNKEIQINNVNTFFGENTRVSQNAGRDIYNVGGNLIIKRGSDND